MWQNPRTAESSKSIWHPISEETFRAHLVQLEERTNAVPIQPEVFHVSAELNRSSSAAVDQNHVLDITVEHQLAEDFAFLAAVEEGAQSVAATCVEEHVDGTGLTLRFAAMDIVTPRHQDALRGVANVLMKVAREKQSKGKTQHGLSDLRGRILRLHYRRIVARLRSIKWPKPRYLAESHKKPLWKDFSNLIHRAQFLYTKRESRMKAALQIRLQRLALLYEEFEEIESDSVVEFLHLSLIVEESFHLCTSVGMKTYLRKLENVRATAQVASAVKCVRQIEKVAAYWRIPQSLLQTTEQHSVLFSNIDLKYLVPYASVPTSISYESWAHACHVHAEIQLLVYNDMYHDKTKLHPRIIGTSKYMCFLCLLFVKAHGRFVSANTHGRLYDQWTIPDLADYSPPQIENYRQIIQDMDSQVVKCCEKEPKWRPEPMTSRQDLNKVEGPIEPWGSNRRPFRSYPFLGSEDDIDESLINLPEQLRVFW